MDTSCSNSLKPSRRKIAEQIARISLPAVVTNISVPLLSIVDTAIVGHMGAQKYIGAVAVGGVIFNVLYWVFAFLRMGTSGLTSQAFGRGDRRDIALQLSRPLALAAVFGLLLVTLGGVAADVAFAFISWSRWRASISARAFSERPQCWGGMPFRDGSSECRTRAIPWWWQ